MAGRISQAAIDDLLSRTDIIEIIQSRITLIKKGKNYKACCPFHDEKTPSFSVNQDKQFYYCFGCTAHGNAIDFLINYDRMGFLDALSFLAVQAGIELKPENGGMLDTQNQALYSLTTQVTQLYQSNLRQTSTAIDYLKKRGINGQTAKDYAIGFAAPGWDNLNRQFDRQSLIDCGMLIQKDTGKTYDRFRNRIMFPIRDVRGRVVAFGGRSLGDEQPKYLNSPETSIFHKSSELYGLYEARKASAKLSRLLIVEGYMDVVVLTQFGLPYAVATLGTAINSRHIQKCLRYTNELVFCFDGDNAGKKAAWKALTLSLPMLRDDIQLRFLFLPEGEDPDSLVQKIGKDTFENRIDQSDALSVVFFNHLDQQCPITSMDTKAQYAHQALQYINSMPKGIFHQLMQKELAERLSITANELPQIKSSTTAQPTRPKPTNRLNPAQLASALLLQQPPLAQQITDPRFLKLINMDGIDLLLELLQCCQDQPDLSAGKLLASSMPAEKKQRIAQLAATQFPFDESGLKEEFEGAMERLAEQYTAQQLDYLIQKAKSTELSADEKKILSTLLATKIPSDRS